MLFGSFDLTGSVTDHIKSVKIGGKTSIFLSFVLKQSQRKLTNKGWKYANRTVDLTPRMIEVAQEKSLLIQSL